MSIRVNYQYKTYPLAPKATAKSRALGMVFSWPMLAVVGFFWYAIMFAVLEPLLGDSDMAVIVGLCTLVPYVILMRKLKARLQKKIDALAAGETLETMAKESAQQGKV